MNRIAIALLVAVTLVCPLTASAQGLLVPIDKMVEPLALKYHRVNVEIREQAAVTTVSQAFTNHTDRLLEATYVFPRPRRGDGRGLRDGHQRQEGPRRGAARRQGAGDLPGDRAAHARPGARRTDRPGPLPGAGLSDPAGVRAAGRDHVEPGRRLRLRRLHLHLPTAKGIAPGPNRGRLHPRRDDRKRGAHHRRLLADPPGRDLARRRAQGGHRDGDRARRPRARLRADLHRLPRGRQRLAPVDQAEGRRRLLPAANQPQGRRRRRRHAQGTSPSS